jgi:UDP-arabinose 4-epimerase
MNPTKSVLVTGGAGYIGSHACKALKAAGYLPVTFDNLSVGHRSAVKWGPLIEADLREKKELQKAFIKYKPIAVMHFAACALVEESIKNPGKYYDNNLFSTLTLLEEMVNFGLKKLIFSSSCATYGIPNFTPITEEHPQSPINPYGKTKLMIEQMLEDYDHTYSLKYVALRYFNAAGADLDSEIGENHKIETHLIPLTIKATQDVNSSINVFGIDYPTKDGSAIRDYIHVVDLIDAHLRSLKYLLKEDQSLKLNLGVGKGYSVLEVVDMVKTITKKDFNVKIEKRRAGDPPILYADCSKAKKFLNWEPKYSDLKTIIRSAWKWHEKLKKES